MSKLFSYENMIKIMNQGVSYEDGMKFIMVEGKKYYIKYDDNNKIYFTELKYDYNRRD